MQKQYDIELIGKSGYPRSIDDIRDWCVAKHESTNHMYDKYLPYEFHLRMVNQVFQQFKFLLTPQAWDGKFLEFTGDNIAAYEAAMWGHDLIEDCRVSYNDCVGFFGQEAADIIYAVTNYRGKNREERAPSRFYEEMRAVPGATFVKLCDRIANVQYSKLTRSKMYDMYKEENGVFINRIGREYVDMLNYLINLFV